MDGEEVKLICDRYGNLFVVWEDGFWSMLKVDSKGYVHAEYVPSED